MALLFLIGAIVGLLVWAANTPDGVGLVAVFLVLLYITPILLAVLRGKRHPGSVIVVNLFFGWTFLGWVIALAMAAGGDTRKDVRTAKA